jgi:hypothetical protein
MRQHIKRCPECGSADIDVGAKDSRSRLRGTGGADLKPTFGARGYWEEVQCNACGKSGVHRIPDSQVVDE